MKARRPRLIVGLGNPGPEYADTPHNSGFRAVDALAAEVGVKYWKTLARALVGETDELILAKPLSFMNLSGQPVKGLLTTYELEPTDLLVIHDDLDLPLGTLRLKVGGGHGGHNGLRSLNECIGADYARLRVGIGRPPGRMDAAIYVLKALQGEALVQAQILAQDCIPLIQACVRDGLTKAMNLYNRDSGEKTAAAESDGEKATAVVPREEKAAAVEPRGEKSASASESGNEKTAAAEADDEA